MVVNQNTQSSDTSARISKFIDEVVAQLQVHQLQFDTETASPELADMYNALINHDYQKVAYMNLMASKELFSKQMITMFIKGIEQMPLQLAFNVSKNSDKITAWVVINDDDEAQERAFHSLCAKVNAVFIAYPYRIALQIWENCDNIKLPTNFISFNNN